MKYKYAALVVLYNPTDAQIRLLENCIPHYDVVYVYDNSESIPGYIDECVQKGIIYEGNTTNEGLSIAYNRIIERALTDNIDWLSIYDQDSYVTESMITKLKEYSKVADFDKVASIVPVIQYGEEVPRPTETKSVLWAINSGQMINLKVIYKNNIKYDENLFLDRVDRDFCKQIELKRLKIMQVGGAVLKQQLGTPYRGYNIHSPVRNYYIYKNRLYYNTKHYGKLKGSTLSFLQTIRHIVGIILAGYEVGENLKMVRLAHLDYKRHRFGKMLN